ncbi:MAG: Pvc16 family protein [Chloroflexota bacterium]
MFADLDETIKQLLVAEVPVKNGEVDIKFDQPKREWSARLTKPTINFFLYDVRENVVLRRHQWEQVAGNGNSAANVARLKRTPFRLDCYYMLTTWAAEAEDEHRLMGRTLMALFRHPVIPAERLVGNMINQPYELQARVASHDKLTNPAEVWGALDNEMRPSVSYIVTVALDPWREVTGPIVRTFTMRARQAANDPRRRRLIPEAVDVEMNFIGGTVRDGGRAPQAGIEVAIKGTGYFSTTDEDGRFWLGGMLPGEYTLVAWPAEGKPREKKIIVPAAEGDYDLEL